MCPSGRPVRLLITAVLAALSVSVWGLAAITPAAAAAGFNLRQLPGAAGGHHAAGLRASTPSASALSGSLEQTTGLTPSQVAAQDVCATARPGQAQCASQVIVQRSDRRLVHPHVHAHPTFTQVFPRGRPARDSAAPAAGTTSSSASPPGAGTPAYLQQAYDLTYLSQTDGGSDTVAIVDAGDDPTAESDLATYRANFGLPACTHRQRLFSQGQPIGPELAAARPGLGLARGGVAGPRRGLGAVPQLPHPVRRGQLGVHDATSMPPSRRPGRWAPTRSRRAGAAAASRPIGSGTFPARRCSPPPATAATPAPATTQYPAGFPGVTAVGGTTLGRRHHGHEHPRLQRVGVGAEQRLGRRLGLQHAGAQAVLADRHRLHRPFLRRRVGRRRTQHRPDRLRRAPTGAGC